ncbi:MAG: sensor histidine kinase [Ekhidna sp.]
MISFLKKRWVYHLLLWIAFFISLTFLDWIEKTKDESILELEIELLKTFPAILYIVYLNFSIKSYFFDRRKYLIYCVSLLLLIISGTYFLDLLDDWNGGLRNSIEQNGLNVLAIIPISLGLQYFKRGVINQYQLQELRVRTSETELNALKAQINPHFLFNTLNNIYGMNQINSDKASEMIMELSDVMRYHLEFSKKGTILLSDEIQLLTSYIQLEKLRINDNCDLQLDILEGDFSLSISPLLLLPLVENAFKHGTHPTSPSFIHLSIKTSGRKLYFTIKNSIHPNRKVIKTNLGLKNTMKRLEIIYGGKYELKTSEDQATYLVKLGIEL